MMEFAPCGQRVVIKKLTEEEWNGLALPKELLRKRTLIGQVLHAGPDATWISEGDKVLFGTFSGFEPFLMGELKKKYEDCLIMNCEDILAVVKETKDEAIVN